MALRTPVYHALTGMDSPMGYEREMILINCTFRKISSLTIDIKGLDGRYVLYTIYWGINLILCLCNLDLSNLGYVRS